MEDQHSTARKSAIVMIAYHHDSSNIASLRFRGLLKYVDRGKTEIHVISATHYTGPLGSEPLCPNGANRIGIDSARSIMWLAFLPKLYKAIPKSPNIWIDEAIHVAENVVNELKGRGLRVLVGATYSPLEALFVAREVSRRTGVSYWADFRDGLSFEGLGRKGSFFTIIRKALENRVLDRASFITSVSSPLVRYFEQTYPKTPVKLLSNGFDPDILNACNTGDSNRRTLDISIGYFGRISASDGSAFGALEEFIKVVSAMHSDSRPNIQFVGNFTAAEISLLTQCKFPVLVRECVSRNEAHEMMRACNALILLTGNRVGTVTGKLFEYLACSRRVVLISLVENEAAKILAELGDDDFIHIAGKQGAVDAAISLAACLSRPLSRNTKAMSKFSRKEQAKLVDFIIDHCT